MIPCFVQGIKKWTESQKNIHTQMLFLEARTNADNLKSLALTSFGSQICWEMWP